MAENKKIPEIRFKGFSEDWVDCELGEVLSLLKDGTHGTHKDVEDGIYLLSAKNIKNGIITIDKTDRKISVEEYNSIHKKFKIEKYDVLLTIVGSIGEVAVVINPDKITFQRSVAYLRPNEELTSQFLYSTINTCKFQIELKNRQVVSAQPGIYLGYLSIIPIKLPSREEQIKVGNFFKQFDNLISLHQTKLEKTLNIKKAMLERMFPKNGENKPEVRFKGFTDKWEECELGNKGETRSGIGFPDGEQGGKEGIPFFKVSDMNNNGNEHEMLTSNNYVSPEQVYRKKWNPIEIVPSVIFAKVGAAIMLNRKRLVRNPFLIDNNTMAYLFDDSWDTNFGKTLFETINLPKYAQIGALPSYNATDIEKIVINAPNKLEQKRIGDFFKNFDKLIFLHRQELEKLKNIKKACLEKMFV